MGLIRNIITKIRWSMAQSQSRVIREYRRLGATIGEGCELQKGITFGSEPYLVAVGNNVRINTGVHFITHDGGVWILRNNGDLPNGDVFGRIIIGNNVAIGHNSIIMPGVVIGDNVVIGIGSIVTKSIPSNSIAAGVPAKVIESYDDYLRKVLGKCVYTKQMSSAEKRKFLLEYYNI